MASSTANEVVIKIGADGAGLDAGLKATEAKIHRFAEKANAEALAKAYKAQAQSVSDINAQIEQVKLRTAGKSNQAEIAAIKYKYDRQIAIARDANQVESAIRLRELQKTELMAARIRQKSAASAAMSAKVQRLGSGYAPESLSVLEELSAFERKYEPEKIRNIWKQDLFSGKDVKKSLSLESLARSGLVVSASVNAANIATKVLSGNLAEAADEVKSLPLGIGQMAGALEQVIGELAQSLSRRAEDLQRIVRGRGQPVCLRA